MQKKLRGLLCRNRRRRRADCQSVKAAEPVAYEDLGAEAIVKLTVENLSATVVIDCVGNNAYEAGRAAYREAYNGKSVSFGGGSMSKQSYLRQRLSELPDFVFTYIQSYYDGESVNTQIAYSIDIKVFLTFLQLYRFPKVERLGGLYGHSPRAGHSGRPAGLQGIPARV